MSTDWAALHRDLADVFERHGLPAQAEYHRILAGLHEAARRLEGAA